VAPTHLQRILDELPNLATHFAEVARTRASGVTYRVEPKLPADVLGVYVYLPAE